MVNFCIPIDNLYVSISIIYIYIAILSIDLYIIYRYMCDIEENNIQYTPAPSFLGKERGGANTNVVSISSGGDRIDDSKLTTKKRNI